MTKELPRRSTGNVVEPGDGYLANGHPDLSPDAGYDAARPVQYSDESDITYKQRLADFELREAHAKEIASASGSTQDSLESRKLVIKAQRAKEDAAFEEEEARAKNLAKK